MKLSLLLLRLHNAVIFRVVFVVNLRVVLLGKMGFIAEDMSDVFADLHDLKHAFIMARSFWTALFRAVWYLPDLAVYDEFSDLGWTTS